MEVTTAQNNCESILALKNSLLKKYSYKARLFF